MTSLVGKVCIVTGASRGIGKGIAVQLGEAGAKVYVTGRTLDPVEGSVGGSLSETVAEIENRGGQGVAVVCDHSKDAEIEELFEKVNTECEGQLDLLVNCCFSAVGYLVKVDGKKFYELDYDCWDHVNKVGLRANYVASVLAGRMMVPRKTGLIINISSMGGLVYMFNAAYGVGKCAMDRMAQDCAVELSDANVAFVSLWPGAVSTEVIKQKMDETMEKETDELTASDKYFMGLFTNCETPEFTGKAITHLLCDKNIMAKSGNVLMTADLAEEYGFTDIDGTHRNNVRTLKGCMYAAKYNWLGAVVPRFIRLPFSVIRILYNMVGPKH